MADDRRKLIITKLNGNYSLLFPITPFPKFKSAMDLSTEKSFGHGEVDLGATRNLTIVTMSGIFPHPDNGYNFIFSKGYSPMHFVNYLYQWMENQNDLLMQYRTDTQKICHLNCRVQDFDFAEEDGTKNVRYNLTLREYRKNNLNVADDEAISARARETYGSDFYYVDEGDTLISIAKKIYGDSSMWKYLQNKNDLKNPLVLEFHQQLRI